MFCFNMTLDAPVFLSISFYKLTVLKQMSLYEKFCSPGIKQTWKGAILVEEVQIKHYKQQLKPSLASVLLVHITSEQI